MKHGRADLTWSEVRRPRGRRRILAVCILGLLLTACTVDQSALLFSEFVSEQSLSEPVSTPAGEAAALPVEAADAAAAAERDMRRADLETGFTADGYPYLGSAAAPVVLIEFSDFHCPYCQQHNQETLPRYVEEFVRTGEVQYVAKDLPLESLHPQSRGAHRAAWCVALQSTDAFWWIHTQLYATQSQHARSQDAPAFYRMLAEQYNADPTIAAPLDVEAFTTCQLDLHNEVGDRIDAAIQEARSAGFNGTPTFVMFYRDVPARALPLSGALPYEDMARVTRNLGEFLNRMEAESARADQLPYWITDEGLAPADLWLRHRGDTLSVVEGVTHAGDYFLGSPFAEVVVFEFSDFECPYCRQHKQETQPFLEARYVATHQVMWVYKHFPLDIHPYAPYAAEAALCAGEQGRFWQMHGLLFAAPSDWAHADYAAALLDYSAVLVRSTPHLMRVSIPEAYGQGTDAPTDPDWLVQWERTEVAPFDEAAYAACLVGSHYEDMIAQGISDVTGIVRGTPTFLIWHRRYGALAQPIVGSLEKDMFANVFDQIFTQLAALENAGSE